MNINARFSSSAGIAIGPILFVLAILAVLAAVIAAGGSDYQVAGGADRITADITAQANLIRNTINECNLQYNLTLSTNAAAQAADPYPATPAASGSCAANYLVSCISAATCTSMVGGNASSTLWDNGANNILLPQPTAGFNPWSYINSGAEGGGRCIWTSPIASNQENNPVITSGLTRAANKFNTATSYSANSEVIYNPSSTSQKFIVWITLPTSTPDPNCLP